MVATPATRAIVEAPHGAAISALAITPDGTAAITADETGGIRLWPKLDGTREPCVVELPNPRVLALARHRDGFFVAWIDNANSLALAELDDRGRTRRHGAVAQDADYLGLAITDLGLLAWRSDQTIVLYDFDGVQLGRIGTEPGERLVNVSANGSGAVAVVAVRAASAEGRVVRPLRLAPALAWDKPFEAGGGDPSGPVAISKSGKRIALISSPDTKTQELRIVERSTGRLLASSPLAAVMEIGFTDEDHVAVGLATGAGWLATTKGSAPALAGAAAPAEQFATADNLAVIAMVSELQLARRDGAQYLGYGLSSPQVATLGPNHGLVVGMAKDFVQLDAALASTSAKPPAIPTNSTLLELHWMGGSDYAANVMDANGRFATLILSSEGREPVALRSSATSGRTLQPLRYEPSTQVLAVSFGEASVERWSAAQRKIEYLASFPRPAASRDRQLVPLAPALAGGKELVDVSMANGATVAWTDATTKQRSAAMPVAAFITADAAGHVYAWTIDPATSQLVISVLAPGKVLHTLPHDGTVTLWPDPKGTRVAEVGATQVTLYKVDGTLVWKQSITGANQVLWPTDDTVAIITAAGIARADAATGVVTSARCGWSFGLQPQPHPPSVRIEPICTQLGR
jgi:WD40 repeat protein